MLLTTSLRLWAYFDVCLSYTCPKDGLMVQKVVSEKISTQKNQVNKQSGKISSTASSTVTNLYCNGGNDKIDTANGSDNKKFNMIRKIDLFSNPINCFFPILILYYPLST